MDKTKAMRRVNDHLGLGYRLLDGRNTHYSSVNASKPVW